MVITAMMPVCMHGMQPLMTAPNGWELFEGTPGVVEIFVVETSIDILVVSLGLVIKKVDDPSLEFLVKLVVVEGCFELELEILSVVDTCIEPLVRGSIVS
jgi:hypothetical protein